MDPRERADAALARARARGAYVVTPESATSPMDAASTLQIPRTVVSAIDRGDPESTLSIPAVRPEEELPAIAQEAATQSLASPPPRRPSEPARPAAAALSWAPPVAPDPEPERVEGLIPTVKQPPARRSSLSQRLDG
ncbi:hypothetical protein [Actinophytocola sp.]|uniref:hypothetical protein n=1 Tax=Actinophytocola sp. TaxID=1872138 RepID=UPI002D8114E4|nr:hypothetical protein [Actinophytocola sp.]HET9140907.1 hypothetical protein [Actinophytocola sp.]